MNRQKILIIITIALAIIVVGSILLVKPSPAPKKLPAPIPRITKITQILPQEDPSAEYSPLTPIEITFSADFNLDGLEIITSPKTEIIYYTVNSKTLRLLPKKSWALGKSDFIMPDGSKYSLNTAWPKNPDGDVEY